jgi:hypothetical protein
MRLGEWKFGVLEWLLLFTIVGILALLLAMV